MVAEVGVIETAAIELMTRGGAALTTSGRVVLTERPPPVPVTMSA